MWLCHVLQKLRIIPTLIYAEKTTFATSFEEALNTHQSAKKYWRLFAITPVNVFLRTSVGAYSNMTDYSVKYISINILNKILQMVVPKTGDYNQMGVKWNCSFATRFFLSCKQFHFGNVSERERCFKLGLSTSEADTQSENSVSFFFKRFLPFAHTPTETPAETMISHYIYNLPNRPDKRT